MKRSHLFHLWLIVVLGMTEVLVRSHDLQAQALAVRPPITALSITPDSTAVVVGSQDGIEIRDARTLARIQSLATKIEEIHDLAFSQDRTLLAVVGGIPGEEGEFELFEWPSGRLKSRRSLSEDLLYSLSWHPTNRWIAIGCADSVARIIDLENEGKVEELRGHSRPILAVHFLPNGNGLLSSGVDESVRHWETENPMGTSYVLKRSLSHHTRAVLDLAVSPDPDQRLPIAVSVGSDRTVRLWQPTIGRMMRFLRLKSTPLSIVWSQERARLIMSCSDGWIRVIDPESMVLDHEISLIDGPAYCLDVDPNGRVYVGGPNGIVRAMEWDHSKNGSIR